MRFPRAKQVLSMAHGPQCQQCCWSYFLMSMQSKSSHDATKHAKNQNNDLDTDCLVTPLRFSFFFFFFR